MIVGNFLDVARRHADLRDRPASSRHRGAERQLYAVHARARFRSSATSPTLMTNTVAGAFRIGIQLSAPFLVFGLLFNLGLGVLSRLMPQMQVFFVGLPLSILIGLSDPAARARRDDERSSSTMSAACCTRWRRMVVRAAMAEENRRTERSTEDPTPEAAGRGARPRRRRQKPGGQHLVRDRRRHADADHGVRRADGVEPADNVPRAHCQIASNPDRRPRR